jgi:hypothetical protein
MLQDWTGENDICGTVQAKANLIKLYVDGGTTGTIQTSVGIGKSLSFEASPNMEAPNGAYSWEVTGDVEASTSGTLCSVVGQTTGTAHVKCAYAFDVCKEGFWNWEETSPWQPGAYRDSVSAEFDLAVNANGGRNNGADTNVNSETDTSASTSVPTSQTATDKLIKSTPGTEKTTTAQAGSGSLFRLKSGRSGGYWTEEEALEDVRLLKVGVPAGGSEDDKEAGLSKGIAHLGHLYHERTDSEGYTWDETFTVPKGMIYRVGGLADDTISYTVFDQKGNTVGGGGFGGAVPLWAAGLGVNGTTYSAGTYRIQARFVNTVYACPPLKVDNEGFSLYKIREYPTVDHIEMWDLSIDNGTGKPKGGWVNLNGQVIPKGVKVKLRAVPNLAGADFADGEPTWGGSAKGSGAQITTSFKTTSTSAGDVVVTAVSGNTTPAVAHVTVFELALYHSGTNITTLKTPENWVVGKKVGLSIGTIPAGLSIKTSGEYWTVGGDAVKGYTCTAPLGEVTRLGSPDLRDVSSVGFYWYKGGAKSAKVTCTVSGKWNMKAAGKINVKKPTATMTSITGDVRIALIGPNSYVQLGSIEGNGIRGITFNAIPENKTGLTGQYGFIQLITANNHKYYWDGIKKPATCNKHKQCVASGHDDKDTYYEGLLSEPASGTALTTRDSPAVELPVENVPINNQGTVKANEDFIMYFFFKADGDSIPVAIATLSWGWTAVVKKQPNTSISWETKHLQSGKMKAKNPAGSSCCALPTWTRCVTSKDPGWTDAP